MHEPRVNAAPGGRSLERHAARILEPPQISLPRIPDEVLLTRDIAFVSTNNAIYGIDTTTHQTVWSYPINNGARLALSANGVLYLQSAGPLTAINVK